MSQCQVIKFKNRTSSNTSDKRIADAYSKGGKFDVNLVTADEKVVSAHRFVLSMFSKYLAKKLSGMEYEGKVLIPLKEIPYDALKKVVELLYLREVKVTAELQPKVMNALKFLHVDLVYPDLPTNAAMNMQAQYTPGKRQRAQSTFVASSQREFAMSAVPASQRRMSVAPSVQKMPPSNVSNFKLPANVTLKEAPQPIDTSGGQIKTRPDVTPFQIPKGVTIQKTMGRASGKMPTVPMFQMQDQPHDKQEPRSVQQSPSQNVPQPAVSIQKVPKPASKPGMVVETNDHLGESTQNMNQKEKGDVLAPSDVQSFTDDQNMENDHQSEVVDSINDTKNGMDDLNLENFNVDEAMSGFDSDDMEI